MIVYNLNVVGVTCTPSEANPPLLINADAVLPFPVAAQGFKTVTWRYAQLVQVGCRVQHPQFPHSHPLDALRQLARMQAIVELLRLGTSERPNHGAIVTRRGSIGKRYYLLGEQITYTLCLFDFGKAQAMQLLW